MVTEVYWGRPHRAGGVAVVLAILALALLPASAFGGVLFDFGDAPDGEKWGFGKTASALPTGSFPSKMATPGPRHSIPAERFFLGAGVDEETESRQVDKDEFDDGVDADLAPCAGSTLKVALNGTDLSPGDLTAAHTAYVNAWFDWNRDGDFADSSDACRPEWAVQNLPVNMSALAGDGVAVLPVGFDAGSRVDDIWMRVTLTLDESVVSPSAHGPPGLSYVNGETEDYLLPPKAKPRLLKKKKKKDPPLKRGKFQVKCKPNPAIVLHGTTAKVKFAIKDFGKGWIVGAVTKKPKGMKLTPAKPQPKNVPPGFKKIDGFSVPSTQDPPLRVETKTATFSFTRKTRTQSLTCKVIVIHIDQLLPLFGCNGNPCAGNVGTVPPAMTGLTASWTEVPTELVQLSLQSVQAVTEIRLPLQAQTPPWPTGSLQASSDPDLLGCTRGTITPQGGPAALVCTRNNTQINPQRTYTVNPLVAVNSGVPVVGRIVLGGALLSFSAPG
jgi:hypothetical protein